MWIHVELGTGLGIGQGLRVSEKKAQDGAHTNANPYRQPWPNPSPYPSSRPVCDVWIHIAGLDWMHADAGCMDRALSAQTTSIKCQRASACAMTPGPQYLRRQVTWIVQGKRNLGTLRGMGQAVISCVGPT